MTANFKSVSRKKLEDIEFSKKTNFEIGRQKIKQVDKHIAELDMSKFSPKKSSVKINHYIKQPNQELEIPWFNKHFLDILNQKNRFGDQTQKSQKQKNQPYQKILERYGQPFKDQNNLRKRSLSLNKRDTPNKIELSSFGYHQWDQSKLPKADEIFWPPIPQHNCNKSPNLVDYSKNSKRTDLLNMTYNVSDSRFEFQPNESNTSILSTYKNPSTFRIKYTKKKRKMMLENTIQRDNNRPKQFYDQNSEQFKNDLKKGSVEFNKSSRKSFIQPTNNLNDQETKMKLSQSEDFNLSSRTKLKSQVNMSKSTARDDKIFKNTLWQDNCQNEKYAQLEFKEWQKDYQNKQNNSKQNDDDDVIEKQINQLKQKNN